MTQTVRRFRVNGKAKHVIKRSKQRGAGPNFFFRWRIPAICISLSVRPFSTPLVLVPFSRPLRRPSNVRLHEKRVLPASNGKRRLHHCTILPLLCRNRVHGKKKRELKLLLPNEPPEYIDMNRLVPLRKRKQGNWIVFFLTNRYIKLTTAIPTPKSNATAAACTFSMHWVANIGIASKRLTDSSSLFMSNLFVAVCSTLEPATLVPK